jgi:class 3 adenylate cyclase
VGQQRRRLTAILAADVAGYSRLTGADEEGTLERLRALRREVVDPALAEHHGRLVKTTGDGLLVEFASVVDAVRCVIAVQRGMARRNTEVAPERRILFRIGINLGDVVAEGDDLLGDGVNVAARLEGIAEPGAICLSRAAYDQARGKVDLAVRDLGEQRLKKHRRARPRLRRRTRRLTLRAPPELDGASRGDRRRDCRPGSTGRRHVVLAQRYCRAPDGIDGSGAATVDRRAALRQPQQRSLATVPR